MEEHHGFLLCQRFATRSAISQNAFCCACTFWQTHVAKLLPKKCHAGYRDRCVVRQRTTSTLAPVTLVGIRGGKSLPWA